MLLKGEWIYFLGRVFFSAYFVFGFIFFIKFFFFFFWVVINENDCSTKSYFQGMILVVFYLCEWMSVQVGVSNQRYPNGKQFS